MKFHLLTIPQVAEILAVKSRDTVYRLIATEGLPVVDIGTSGRPKTRVRSDDLEEWIDKRTRKAPPRWSPSA